MKRVSDTELMQLIYQRYLELRAKYPDEKDGHGWRALALGLAIAALAEEHFNVESYKELFRK